MKEFKIGNVYQPLKSKDRRYSYKIVRKSKKLISYVILDDKPKEVLTSVIVVKNGKEAFKPCNYPGLILA